MFIFWSIKSMTICTFLFLSFRFGIFHFGEFFSFVFFPRRRVINVEKKSNSKRTFLFFVRFFSFRCFFSKGFFLLAFVWPIFAFYPSRSRYLRNQITRKCQHVSKVNSILTRKKEVISWGLFVNKYLLRGIFSFFGFVPVFV